MGRTSEKVIIRNLFDIEKVSNKLLNDEQIRTAEIEAIVDTGAAYLCLPPDTIKKLGLPSKNKKNMLTANGRVTRKVFYGAEIIIQGRECQMQVLENDEQTPALLGYLVLEALDFVVDTNQQKVIPNPSHNGEWLIDMY